MANLWIKNGTLLSGQDEKEIPQAAVCIQGNQILAAGPEASLELPGEETQIIDAQGGYILPGFIDAHVHLNMEKFNLEDWLTRPFSYNFLRPVKFMQRTLQAGITSVRDAGGVDAGMKKAIDEGIVRSPRVLISVNVMSITGGHGDNSMLSGIDPDTSMAYPGFPDGRCDGVDGVRKKTREMLRAGAEVIKVCATGGIISPSDAAEDTQFSLEELKVIVQEAASHGNKRVMAHAQGAQGIKNAVRAGIQSIEHGAYLDEEGIDLLLENGTFLVPTLYASECLTSDPEVTSLLSAVMLEKAKKAYEVHQKNIARAYQAGVKIVMGTDSGMMPHGKNLNELRLLMEIGMSPMEAILASTRDAAKCLGWETKVGTITPGKLADIIICKKDPRDHIRQLTDSDFIHTILKDGNLIKLNGRLVLPSSY